MSAPQGCRLRSDAARQLPPLRDLGEVHVYLDALPRTDDRLSMALESVAVSAAGRPDQPLTLKLRVVSATTAMQTRLLAWGRIAAGSYDGLRLHLGRAQLATAEGGADLLVEARSVLVGAKFAVERRRGTVLCVSFRARESLKGGIALAPVFRVRAPDAVITSALGLTSNRGSHSLTLFDRRSRQVVGVVPTGAGPAGPLIDVRSRRAYVALSREDAIEIIDLGSIEPLDRVALRAGDRPSRLGLAQDVLLSVNTGSNTLAFIDPSAGIEIARLDTGLEPRELEIDPLGRHAYVVNADSNDITIVDVGTQRVAGSIPTESKPLRARLSGDGTRLFVIHEASPFMLVFSVPEHQVVERVFVGPGMRSLGVHRTTGRVFVGMDDAKTLYVFEAHTFLPIETLEVPATVTDILADEAENMLVLVMADADLVAFLRLSDRQIISTMDVGINPGFLALP